LMAISSKENVMCEMCEQLKDEKAAVRPIPIEEAISNENVFAQRVEEKILELLNKYHCKIQFALQLAESASDEEKLAVTKLVRGISFNVCLDNHIEIVG
jgi:hypothetical protein